MTEVFDFDRKALQQELFERAKEEGVSEREAYNEYVDFLVNEKLQVGEESNQDDLNDVIEDLKALWEEYQAYITK